MKRFRNILCVVPPDAQACPALERGVELASRSGARLRAVTVVPEVVTGIGLPDSGVFAEDVQDVVVRAAEQKLEALLAPYAEHLAIDSQVLVGTSYLQIIREVLHRGHDLVIKKPESPAWLGRLLGSDDMHLLRKCPCPVWMTHCALSETYSRILAAVDLESSVPKKEAETQAAMNRQVLEMASSLALSERAELHIVHVWDAFGEHAMQGAFAGFSKEEISTYVAQVKTQRELAMAELLQSVIYPLGAEVVQKIKPTSHLVKGAAKYEIPLLAKQLGVDILVMGTVARTGVPGVFIGNTAESILDQIDCSVLAIKPQGFQTPIELP